MDANGAAQPDWFDVDGQSRIQNATVDVGADEFDGTAISHTAIVIRVSPSGNDANTGSDWALAKRTIQAAIDAATTSGGEVWIAAGTYNERITLKSRAFLYGGFAGTESAREERDWALRTTILDGNALGTVVRALAPGYGSSGIDGLTIRNGKGNDGIGGGIYCSKSSPVISNNIITGNSGVGNAGGGISCFGSSPRITNNTITVNNSGSSGGGIACYNSSAMIFNNTISANTSAHGFEYVNLQAGLDVRSRSEIYGVFVSWSLGKYTKYSSSVESDLPGFSKEESGSIEDPQTHSWLGIGVRGTFE